MASTNSNQNQATEQALSRQAGSKEADEYRDLIARKNQQLIGAGERIAKDIGEPDKVQAGESIQETLRGTQSQRRQEIFAATRDGKTLVCSRYGRQYRLVRRSNGRP